MNDFIKMKTENEITFLKLNRPEKRNALNPELINTLLSFFKESKWDPPVKAIVLSGEGKAFCSGADLKWMNDESAFTSKEMENLFSLFEAIMSCPLPVISFAHGFAVGGGLGLLSVSDVVIAEENTQFRFSETKLGLIPSVISPFVLRKIGLSHAKFLMLSALPFSTKQAQQIGLAHFIGSKKECDIFLQKILENFKELDPSAVSKTKKWLNSAYALPLSQVKKEGVSLISEARKTDSARQRIKNLLENSKRK
ncbi:MAG: enoyl-CoA hydratase/isomerase family protein [Bdellovibrionales bacterium]|nr:enoyl-CoA hydratase/isomerase family protein [Bdellovibrionales bacterium]